MCTTVKTRLTRWMGILMCAVMLVGVLPVGAAASVDTVSATVSPDITVEVDGEVQAFFSVDGVQVHPVLYNGTTYLPVRAIGELMNKNVNWDQSTLTVTLSGARTAPATAGVRDENPVRKTIQAQLRPDFTIVVDGAARTFADAQGNTVYPMLYNGSTYLPVRAIGELMGKTVSWDAETSTVRLSGNAPDDSLVTDADSFGRVPGATQTNRPESGAGSYIGEEKAKSIALAHAGLTESKVTFIKAKLDYDHGRWEYEIEFVSGTWEYEYEIDASTGAVRTYERESIYD